MIFGQRLVYCLFAAAALAVTTTSVSLAASPAGTTAATSAAKKKAAAAAKIIHAKNLRTALKPGTPPGKSSLPLVSDGDFAAAASAGYSVKMRPKNGRSPAARQMARGSNQTTRSANFNEPISNYIRALRVGYNGPVPQLALGQALAVNDSYIVTSADFVSEAWTNSGDVKFFVQDSTQALALVGFDLGSNLAIFSTGLGSHMDHTLPLQRIRVESAVTGEDYTSLGFSGLIGGARRLRPVQDLTFVRERFELPASVALSAGSGGGGVQFLFDKAGRWLGSVSLLDQRAGSRKFDVTSANQAAELIRQLEQHPPQALPSSVLRTQAASWQERWTNTFFESAKKGLALRTLECEAEALHVDDQKLAGELVRTRLVRCNNAMPVTLTRDYAMGVELVTGEVTYSSDVKTFLAHDTSPTTVFSPVSTRQRSPASINVMTGAECEKSDVTNSHGHHMHVRFCTSALKNAAGLNDTTLTVVSSDTGVTSTLHSLHLRGFEPKNTKRFMEWLIETETVQ